MTKMCSIVQDANHHCKTQLKEKTFCYTWSIDDFWKIYKLKAALQSSIAENNLQIRMYSEVDKLRFYGYYIKNESKDSPSSTKFYSLYSIFLKSTEGKVCKIRNEMCLIEKGSSGILYDLPKSYLISNLRKYILNGTLTIYFVFNIFSGMINKSMKYSYKTLVQTDTNSFVSNKISDTVTFVINKEQTLQANKILLCLKSEVFKTMFDCGLKENETNEIEITDIKYDVLKELLFFVQTGYLSKMLKMIDVDVISELFIAAEKYDIKDLKLICEQYLIQNVTIENVVEYFEFAYSNNATVLTKYAKDFIKLYLKDIVHTPNFITLLQKHPEVTIENIEPSITCINNINNTAI